MRGVHSRGGAPAQVPGTDLREVCRARAELLAGAGPHTLTQIRGPLKGPVSHRSRALDVEMQHFLPNAEFPIKSEGRFVDVIRLHENGCGAALGRDLANPLE